jgi:hypothetical protein
LILFPLRFDLPGLNTAGLSWLAISGEIISKTAPEQDAIFIPPKKSGNANPSVS